MAIRQNLEVVADLLSTDAVRVTAAAPVLIEQWGGGHALQRARPPRRAVGFMKVSALGVEEQRVNVIIDFDDPTSPPARSATLTASKCA